MVHNVWLPALFLLTLFGAELFVGLIVGLFEEINSFDSSRLYNVLWPTFNLREQEREDVVTALLELNRQMRPHNRIYADFECSVVRKGDESSADRGSLTSECMALRVAVAALMTEVTQLETLGHSPQTGKLELQHCMAALSWKLQDRVKHIAQTTAQEDVRSAQCSQVSHWLVGLVAAGCSECVEGLLTEKACTEEIRAEEQQQVRLESVSRMLTGIWQVWSQFGYFGTTQAEHSSRWEAIEDACDVIGSQLFEQHAQDGSLWEKLECTWSEGLVELMQLLEINQVTLASLVGFLTFRLGCSLCQF